jgi:predicted ATPase
MLASYRQFDMLKSINFSNFKSYQEGRLPLAPLTVLVGANASGKSNALEALRLLAWFAQGQKLSSIQHNVNNQMIVRGNIETLAYGDQQTFELGCESTDGSWNCLNLTVEYRRDGLHVVGEKVVHADGNVPLYILDAPSTGHGTDVGVAYNNFARGVNKPHVTCTDQMAIFTQLTSPATFDKRHVESQRIIPTVAAKFEKWLSSVLFLDPVPAAMRNYSFPSDFRLQDNGQNLSAVLMKLWGQDDLIDRVDENIKRNRVEILSFIRSLPEQDVAGLSFLREPRGGVMVELTETFGGIERRFDASLLSDGTLRVLAIAAAMLSAEEGSLVVIEEIDNGVHPSRAKRLLSSILEIAERRHLQVLLSTHNPALLDALPNQAIQNVIFCYRDPESGSSRLVRLHDVPDYPELVAQGSLGQLVTSGLLDRFIKDESVDDVERSRRALAWLDSIGDEAAK